MDKNPQTELLRRVFPTPKKMAVGTAQAVGTVVKSAEQIAKASASDNALYMTLASYSTVKGYKRTEWDDPIMHALVLDFDLKHNPQRSIAEFGAALEAFMPEPTARVMSGGGYHYYYCTKKPLATRQNLDNLKRFRRGAIDLAAQHGLLMDRVAGSSPHSIIRVPGSFNPRSKTRSEIDQYTGALFTAKDLSERFPFDGVIKATRSTSALDLPGVRPSSPVVTSTFAATELPAVPLVDLTDGCAAAAEFISAAGSSFDNGTRGERGDCLLMANQLSFCSIPGSDPRSYALDLFSQWPGADASWAEKIYDDVEAEYAQAPMFCDKWSTHFSASCMTCPYKDRDAFSPVMAGREVARRKKIMADPDQAGEAALEYLNLPDTEDEFMIASDGSLVHQYDEAGKGGKVTTRFKEVLRPSAGVNCVRYALDGSLVGLDMHNVRGARRVLPADGLNEPRSRNQTMSQLGVTVMDNEHFKLFLQRMIHAGDAVTEHERLGWQQGKTGRVFVGPGYELRKGTSGACLLSEGAANLVGNKGPIEPGGDLSAWLKAMSVYKDGRLLPYQYFILSSFTAVLYELLPETSGPLVASVGTSGAGKSTALFAANSVWYWPQSTSLASIDTQNSYFSALSTLNNLPATLNETTHLDAERYHQLIFAVTEGQERRGNTVDQTLKTRREWRTCMLTTSNHGFAQMVGQVARGNKGAANRVIELRAPDKIPELQESMDAMMGVLRTNYGVAGRKFAELILDKPHAQLFSDWQIEHRAMIKRNPNIDRFALTHASLTFLVMDLLTSAGMDSFFDRSALRKFIEQHLAFQKEAVDVATESGTLSPGDLMQTFLNHVVPREPDAAKAWLESAWPDPRERRQRFAHPKDYIWQDDKYLYATRGAIQHFLNTLRSPLSVAELSEQWMNSGRLYETSSSRNKRISVPNPADGCNIERVRVFVIHRPDK